MSSPDEWRPAAPLSVLRLRARLLARIRSFFEARGVLEVETPLLAHATVTDPHIESIPVAVGGETLYLQTSPEYAMKRLLAAGTGAIFQISKAFRGGERGPRHNPEFTLVEWYRPGFDHHRLMDEVDTLLQEVLGTPEAERLSYEAVFERHAGLNPHHASASELSTGATALGAPGPESATLSREDWLNWLMARVVEPELGLSRPVLVYDYPRELVALARLRPESPPVAERFELYLQGMEIANGYHELVDASEQRSRFEWDLERRGELGRARVVPDERLLSALEAGLAPGAGVALGFDRLVMVAAKAHAIDDVLAFPFERA